MVQPHIYGRDRKKDEIINSAIQAGLKQHGEKFFDIMENKYGIKKENYLNDSYKNLLNTAQTGGKQAVDSLYNSNNSSQYRNPITNYSATPTKPRNILP